MKALIVVDAQYDFFPATKENYDSGQGGSLAVPNGDQIIPVINKLLNKFELVIFTKDWHPKDMRAFASNRKGKNPFDTYKYDGETHVLWPDHCVEDTYGAMIHEDIDLSQIQDKVYIVKKGTDKNFHPYSGFSAPELQDILEENKVDDVYIVGLALDYCVKDTCIDSAMAGFKTVLIIDGTKPIVENIDDTLVELSEANVKIIESWEFGLFNFKA